MGFPLTTLPPTPSPKKETPTMWVIRSCVALCEIWVVSLLLVPDMATRLRGVFSVLYTSCISAHLIRGLTQRSVSPIHIRNKLPLSHNSSVPPLSQCYKAHTLFHTDTFLTLTRCWKIKLVQHICRFCQFLMTSNCLVLPFPQHSGLI